MKWESNDLVMKVHDEVKGLPLHDTVSFHSVSLTPKSLPTNDGAEFYIETETVVSPTSEEIVRSFRIRDMNDFC